MNLTTHSVVQNLAGDQSSKMLRSASVGRQVVLKLHQFDNLRDISVLGLVLLY